MATTVIQATGTVANPRFMTPTPPTINVSPGRHWFATRGKMTPIDEGYSALEPVAGDKAVSSFGADGGDYYARMNGSDNSLLVPNVGGQTGEFTLAIVGKWRSIPTKNEVLFSVPEIASFSAYLPVGSSLLTHFGNGISINRTKKNLFLYSYFKNSAGTYDRALSVFGVGDIGVISTGSVPVTGLSVQLMRNPNGAYATFDLQYVATWDRGMDATERASVRGSLATSFGITA